MSIGRRKHSPAFKVKVAVEGEDTVAQLVPVGWSRGLPLVCWIEPHFVGPAGLPVKSTAEPFQLPAQLSVGHAATVKLPLPVRCGVTSGGRGTPRSWRD